MSILSNGDLVGALYTSNYWLIKHNKDSGSITCYQNLVAFLYSASSFESSVLTGGKISSSALNRWGIIDSSNTPTIRCNATLPTNNYHIYDSHLISLTDYLLLFSTIQYHDDNTDRIVRYSSCT